MPKRISYISNEKIKHDTAKFLKHVKIYLMFGVVSKTPEICVNLKLFKWSASIWIKFTTNRCAVVVKRAMVSAVILDFSERILSASIMYSVWDLTMQ